jgi:hypothetical protein
MGKQVLSGKFNDAIKVEAFGEDGESLGVFESCSKAARALFIRSVGNVSDYLSYGQTKTQNRVRKGVKSQKTGKRYHFKIVK